MSRYFDVERQKLLEAKISLQRLHCGPKSRIPVKNDHSANQQDQKMFDNKNGFVETPEGGSSSSAEAKLASIRARLDREVPQGIFVPDSWLAKQLYMTPKTLCNRRAQDKQRYPTPRHPGGCRKGLHSRPDLIEWLALEELRHILGPGSR
jgi:hypothetical protein